MEFEPASWRLILHPAARGPWNMAVDEAILEATGRGESSPTLRLYAWQPACLSLGYAQPVQNIDKPSLTALGWDLVRRPTGGRAILHTDELTYAIIAPLSEPRVRGTVLESYSRLAQALVHSLHLLSVPAEITGTNPNHGPLTQPICFEQPSDYEIVADGKKILGSAQARRLGGVLQHGSLPLHGDLTRITKGLWFSNEKSRQEAAAYLLNRATTVEMILGQPVSWEQAAHAFIEAFQRTLNLTFKQETLTDAEIQRANELVTDKYSNAVWTERV